MDQTIKTLIFGAPRECEEVWGILRSAECCAAYRHELCTADDLEDFDAKLVNWEPTLAIVLADGAAGMECVFRSRKRRPCIPVFWFSDDREFGMQSYRLDCAYFSTKPVTPEKIANAIARCKHIGICYAAS